MSCQTMIKVLWQILISADDGNLDVYIRNTSRKRKAKPGTSPVGTNACLLVTTLKTLRPNDADIDADDYNSCIVDRAVVAKLPFFLRKATHLK